MADNNSIKLFEHNEIAYNSAVQMPCRTDKTAKIHPTGADKFFVSFKLRGDNINKKYAGFLPANVFLKRNVKTLRQRFCRTGRHCFFDYCRFLHTYGQL